jgi:hypothetical protein
MTDRRGPLRHLSGRGPTDLYEESVGPSTLAQSLTLLLTKSIKKPSIIENKPWTRLDFNTWDCYRHFENDGTI